MPAISRIRNRTQIEVERLDGGLNQKNGPSVIDLTESPDCLNVTYGDLGSVETREGTSYFNTGAIGTFSVDGGTVYNNTAVVWANGNMYRMSGTTAVTISSAQSAFVAGAYVAYCNYQSMLICSDGTNGPYRFEGNDSFYNLGIAIPSAPTGASNGAGNIAAGTYYYKVAYVNTHLAEGEIGSASGGVTLTGSAVVLVSNIPTGSTIQGVYARRLYRATSTGGTFQYVGEITDNVTTTFTDTVGVGSEGSEGITDGTAPTPFTTVKLHQERLWFDDSENRSIGRYTEYQNPHISKALNVIPLNEGDGSNIAAVGVQDDLVNWMKDESIWLTGITDPSDDTTFFTKKSPANVGIVGPRAFVETDNGIVFVAKRQGRIVGVQLLSGMNTIQTTDQFLRTQNISEKIEQFLFESPKEYWSKMAMTTYDNRIYIAFPYSLATRNDYILWFDINRLDSMGDGQPGSWSPWDGIVGVTDFFTKDGVLYGTSSNTDGYIIRFNNGTYTDADGSAIDSYWWSKEIGGEKAIESWVKDWRFVNVWRQKIGAYNMNLKVRLDGAQGTGDQYPIDLTPSTSAYGTSTWGYSYYAEGSRAFETQVPIGPKVGRRVQIGFDNQNTAGQGFKVHSFKILFNLRRQA